MRDAKVALLRSLAQCQLNCISRSITKSYRFGHHKALSDKKPDFRFIVSYIAHTHPNAFVALFVFGC